MVILTVNIVFGIFFLLLIAFPDLGPKLDRIVFRRRPQPVPNINDADLQRWVNEFLSRDKREDRRERRVMEILTLFIIIGNIVTLLK
jgi:hypothetical protein